MTISMAGLASANAGGLQAERQRVVDAEAARKNQADQLQFEQLLRQEALRSRVDPVINGEQGLGDATPAPQTNGSRLKDSVMGLFSASPSTAASDSSSSATPQPSASMGASTPSLAQPAQPVSTAKLMQQRVNDYAAKNPNDIAGINAMQNKAYEFAQNEVTKKQNVFLAQGNEAIRKLVAFNDVSGVQDLMSNHWPDGKQYQFQANKDGSYDVAEVGGTRTKHFSNMDELGRTITNVLSPAQYQAAHAKAQETGLTEGAKLPAQQALETTKAEAKAKGDTETAIATGMKDQHLGDAARFRGMANKDNAEAGEKTFDTAQKRALAEAKAQLDAVDQITEPSKYKELQKKVARLEPRQVNVGGLHTIMGKDAETFMPVPIITDPVTGKVYQGGNVIYDRSSGSSITKQTPPPAAGLPSGFKPL